MRPCPTFSMTVAVVVLAASAAFAQHGAVDGEWRSFAGLRAVARTADPHDAEPYRAVRRGLGVKVPHFEMDPQRDGASTAGRLTAGDALRGAWNTV